MTDHSAIEQVILREHEDNFAPANSQLKMQLVGDLLFFDVEMPGDGDLSERPKSVSNFGINLRTFKLALEALERGKQRCS